jgi:hypothetical protein
LLVALAGALGVHFEAIQLPEKSGEDLSAGGAACGCILHHAVDGAIQCSLQVFFLSEESGLDDCRIVQFLPGLRLPLVLLDAVKHGEDVEVLASQPLMAPLLLLR